MIADSTVFLERILSAQDGLQRFRFRETIISCPIPSDSLPDASLPEFISSVATTKGIALDQLISATRDMVGSVHYGGWIDQAVFTIRRSSPSGPEMLRDFLPCLADDPIDQYGDAFFSFVPDDLSFLSMIEVSREARFVSMAHYCDDATIHAQLISAR